MKKTVQKEYEKLGKKFALKVLTKLSEVKAMAFEGAVARGYADRYSDIDIICLCNKIPSQQKRAKLLRPLVSKLNEDYKIIPKKNFERGDYLEYKGKHIGIGYKKIKDLNQTIKDVKSGKPGIPARLAKIVTEVYYTKIIYDPQKIYFKLREKVPKSDATKIVKLVRYNLSNITLKGKWPKWGLQAALYRKSFMEINRTFLEAIDYYLKLLYAINNEYFFVPKWAHHSIKKLKIKPKRCWERIQIIFKFGNDIASVKKKARIFKSLMDDLYVILEKEELK